jgi:predicted nucleic acid-binding protein
MIVVTDTTPLRYLVEIALEGVLPALFGEVYTAPMVLEELAHPVAPSPVRMWASSPASWLHVRTPLRLDPITATLHAGESQAISLAMELRPARVLIDDRAGWLVANAAGLTPLRTLPVLWVAGELGLIDLDAALTRLRATTYRVSAEMLDRFRRRDQELRDRFREDVEAARRLLGR